MIWALLLAVALKAAPQNQLSMSAAATAQWNIVCSYTPTNTPTATATVTPLPVPVTSGTTRRILSVGNSHWSAGNCSDANEYDGARPAFLAAYKDATGGLGYFVGSYLRTYPTPLVQSSYTNAVGGTYSTDAYIQIRDNLPGLIGTPTSDDRFIIMSAANDAKLGWTAQQEEDSAYAQSTKTAAIDNNLGKIWLCTDFPIKGYDTTAVSQGVRNAYARLRADGYTHVYLIDTATMVNFNPPTYLPDFCADPDPGHLTISGDNKIGAAMVVSLQASGGL